MRISDWSSDVCSSDLTISATFSGLAGALLAMNNEAANYVLFDMTLSTQVVLNSYIGGIGAFFGPALGAAVMTFFGYAVSDMTRTWLLYQGGIFVLVMMFMPAGLFRDRKSKSLNSSH